MMPKTKRPSRHSDEIDLEVAKLLLPAFMEWAGKHDGYSEADVLESLLEAIECHEDDGYRIAYHLDGEWRVDAALVNLLDSASYHRHRAHKAACVKWLSESGLTPPELESRVATEKHGTGVVTENHVDGTSTVFFAHLGHVREGTGTHGLIIEWEELLPAPAPEGGA
jgi:hypothetical protein